MKKFAFNFYRLCGSSLMVNCGEQQVDYKIVRPQKTFIGSRITTFSCHFLHWKFCWLVMVFMKHHNEKKNCKFISPKQIKTFCFIWRCLMSSKWLWTHEIAAFALHAEFDEFFWISFISIICMHIRFHIFFYKKGDLYTFCVYLYWQTLMKANNSVNTWWRVKNLPFFF